MILQDYTMPSRSYDVILVIRIVKDRLKGRKGKMEYVGSWKAAGPLKEGR